MDLTKILSISGKPGLYKLIAQTKTGMVVESLIDNQRTTVFANQRVSSLEEISVYSYTDDMPLKDVFKMIATHTENEAVPDTKENPSVLRTFFEAAVPDYDKERVYDSDIRKILAWYNQLQGLDLLSFDEVEGEEEGGEEDGEAAADDNDKD